MNHYFVSFFLFLFIISLLLFLTKRLIFLQQYSSYKDSIISQFPVLSKADWSLFDSALESFSNAATTAQVLVNASDPSVNDVLIRMDRQVSFFSFLLFFVSGL